MDLTSNTDSLTPSAREALQRFREQRGFNSPWHYVIAGEAPELLDAYLEYFKTLYDRPVLDPKIQELIIIGVNCRQF